jgi:hypothetical protein
MQPRHAHMPWIHSPRHPGPQARTFRPRATRLRAVVLTAAQGPSMTALWPSSSTCRILVSASTRDRCRSVMNASVTCSHMVIAAPRQHMLSRWRYDAQHSWTSTAIRTRRPAHTTIHVYTRLHTSTHVYTHSHTHTHTHTPLTHTPLTLTQTPLTLTHSQTHFLSISFQRHWPPPCQNSEDSKADATTPSSPHPHSSYALRTSH